MPTVWPTYILIVAAALTVAPATIAWLTRRREVARLRSLAARHGCDYDPRADDDLARRLGGCLPAVGPAAVRARDVFGLERPAGRELVVRVDYTLGSVRSRRNVTKVIAVAVSEAGQLSTIAVASAAGSTLAQFERLLARADGDDRPAADGR